MTDTPEDQTLLWSALCQSQRLEVVGETTGGMIHELNNGLSVVNGLVELLLEKLNDSPDTENLPTAGSEDLLDMARRDLAKVVVDGLQHGERRTAADIRSPDDGKRERRIGYQ